MWPFDRRPKITISNFIERETSRVLTPGYGDSLRDCIRQAGFPNVVDVEIVALRYWMTLAGASLAKLPHGVQRGVWRSVNEEAERRHGIEWRNSFEETSVEYMRLMSKDMGHPSGAQFLPGTMSFALNRIVGRSDESVVVLRMALLHFTLGVIKSESDFYRDIRLVK